MPDYVAATKGELGHAYGTLKGISKLEAVVPGYYFATSLPRTSGFRPGDLQKYATN